MPDVSAAPEAVTEWGIRLEYGDEASRHILHVADERTAREYKRIYGDDMTLFSRQVVRRIDEWQEVTDA